MTAREEEVVFPRNFYNNYYELTKAMASIETERFIVERRLRVVELCPGDRHRRIAGRQQPRRHQGGQRAGQRLRPCPPGSESTQGQLGRALLGVGDCQDGLHLPW